MLRYFTSPDESPSTVMRKPASMLWRTKRDSDFYKQTARASTPPVRTIPDRVYQNSKGQRIDVPKQLHVNPALLFEIRDRHPRLCNAHHLFRSCTKGDYCPYDHHSKLTDRELEALVFISRSQVCPQGSACTFGKCTKGHMCLNGDSCKHGNSCRFGDLHDIDTEIATEVTAS